jgi:hypothetical protein
MQFLYELQNLTHFEVFFYKKYWHIVGCDLVDVVALDFKEGHADRSLLNTQNA